MTMNPLARYLGETGIRQRAFAEQIGRTQATVSRILAGERRVSMDTAIRIERATGGRVPVSAWVDVADVA